MSRKTIAQLRQGIRTIRSELKGSLVEPVNIEASLAAKDVRKAVKSTSLGQALWGRRRRNRKQTASGTPSLSIKKKRTRLSASSGGVIGGFDVAGVAAMIVVGGRTSAHTIQAGGGGASKLLSFGPGEVAAGAVKHPGSIIRSHSAIVNRAMDKAADRLEARLGRLLESTARAALR